MFSTDAELDVRSCLLTELYSHLHEFAYACLVDALERIILEDALVSVFLDDLACIVS